MSSSLRDRSSFGSTAKGLTRSYTSLRSLIGMAMTTIVGACLVITLVPLFAVIIYVIRKGFNRLDRKSVV